MDKLFSLLKTKSVLSLKKDVALLRLIRREFNSIVGPQLFQELTVGFIKNKTLVLYTKNPCWIQEVHFFKAKLLEKIRAVTASRAIKDVKIKLERRAVPLRDKPAFVLNKSGSLLDKIVALNREKKTAGYQYCTTCKAVLTLGDTRLFCLTEKNE